MSREGERALLLGEETEEGEKRWERGGFGGFASRKVSAVRVTQNNSFATLPSAFTATYSTSALVHNFLTFLSLSVYILICKTG